jgi:hypothetical protein
MLVLSAIKSLGCPQTYNFFQDNHFWEPKLPVFCHSVPAVFFSVLKCFDYSRACLSGLLLLFLLVVGAAQSNKPSLYLKKGLDFSCFH